MWIIVSFIQENSVEEKWVLLDDCKCFWPPYRESKLKYAIGEKSEVRDDWVAHPIRVFNKNKRYGIYIE